MGSFSYPSISAGSFKRNSEGCFELEPSNKKLKIKEYVSMINGSIREVHTQSSLLCYLYENRSDLIKTIEIDKGKLTDIRIINSKYCKVNYEPWLKSKKCHCDDECIVDTYGPKLGAVLDFERQVLFTIDNDKWYKQEDKCKDWSFVTNDLVIKYVRSKKPKNLIVSSIAGDEAVYSFKKNNEVICIKTKGVFDIFVMC